MIQILRSPIRRHELQQIADTLFGDLVKAVVDIQRGVMAVGGELHADEEAALLEEGSKQQDLWGINIYPRLDIDAMIEFDSMINVRPSQGNRSRSVEDAGTQQRIKHLVGKLIVE